MSKERERDPAMVKAKAAFERSGLTLAELGARMSYPPATARQAAFQFLDKTDDPSLSMLRRFAKALGMSALWFNVVAICIIALAYLILSLLLLRKQEA